MSCDLRFWAGMGGERILDAGCSIADGEMVVGRLSLVVGRGVMGGWADCLRGFGLDSRFSRIGGRDVVKTP